MKTESAGFDSLRISFIPYPHRRFQAVATRSNECPLTQINSRSCSRDLLFRGAAVEPVHRRSSGKSSSSTSSNRDRRCIRGRECRVRRLRVKRVRISHILFSFPAPSDETRVVRFRATGMHKTNSIVMKAPRMSIFEIAANLELWPKILPHYRYIRYLERSPNRNVVVMAARRSGIPIKWTSEQIIDRERVEVRFHHLKAFSKGMDVVWTFEEKPDGVLVTIVHDLHFRIPALAPIAEPIIGDFFTHNIANKTLRCMTNYVDAKASRW